jgi:hypothetical protein
MKVSSLLISLALLGSGAAPGLCVAAEQKIDAGCTPGVSFWSLLSGVSVDYTSGYLHLGKIYAVCLPQPATPSDSNYAYSPDSGGKLASVVKTNDGQVLATYVWSAENISGLWELSNYKVIGGEASIKPLPIGGYTLEFQIEGVTFYRFPFHVSFVTSDDPYQAPGMRYFIGGPWEYIGNIFYQRNDPEQPLRFTAWLQDTSGHAQQKSKPYTAELLRASDGGVIGADTGDLRVDQQWRQLDIFFHPAGDANASVKAAQVLHEDGGYKVRITVDGKLHGVYPFSVRDGKIDLQGRQLPSTPAINRIVDYLYGGRYRSWWMSREPPTFQW